MTGKPPELDVLGQLYLDLLHKRPVPAWLASAFVERFQKGAKGEIHSWDEVFGRPARWGSGEKVKRRTEQERLVAEEVERLQAEERSLNEEEFAAIGLRLGVGGKSKVKELLADARLWAEGLASLFGPK